MNNGWIKIHRSLLDWEWYDDINAKVLFLHLLLKANIEDKKWHGIMIKRGEYMTSYNLLAKETRLSIMQIRNTLDKLKVTHEITHRKELNGSVISITNYDKFQDSNTRDNTQITHDVTDGQHTPNTPITTTKESKEGKEPKEVKNSYGMKGFVKLSEIEYSKLEKIMGKQELERLILESENYHVNTKPVKDFYLTINNWHKRNTDKQKQDNMFSDEEEYYDEATGKRKMRKII